MSAPDVAALVATLRAAGDPSRAEQGRRYLKSELVHWGVPVPTVTAAVADWWRTASPRDRDTVLGAAAALWSEPVHEARLAAVKLLARGASLLTPADLPFVERLLREARTWAYVDELATAVAAPLFPSTPEAVAVLDRWAADPDFWLRRAALLVHLVPLRRGAGDFARFGRYADALLGDGEFFVRKAIGWVLRDTSRKRPDLVTAWLLPRAHRCAGVTIREAVRHLPADDAAAVLAVWRDGPPGPAPWATKGE